MRLQVLLLCVLLFGTILPASIAQAGESLAVGAGARSVSGMVMPGQEFAVTVTFTAPADDSHAIGLVEVAPAGWKVTVDVSWTDPQAMVAHTPKPEEAVYIWAGPYRAGTAFTAVYKVRVPTDARPGTYAVGGILKYYIEPYPAPAYQQQVTRDTQLKVAPAAPVTIAGVIRGVDGTVLPGTAVRLSQKGQAIADVVSDQTGYYRLEFSGLGDYEVAARKDGFRVETQAISVSGPATYRLDFVGDHGLIPDAPSTSYVLECTSLWKSGQAPLRLSLFKMLDVISAWKYPYLAP